MSIKQIFLTLLLSGMFLLGIEIFVPGGVLGLMGACALVGSMVLAFKAFPEYGPLIAAGILALTAACIYAWMRFFPKCRLGKALTLSEQLDQDDTEQPLNSLLGQTGTTRTRLNPSGIAEINGHRVDVVSDDGWLEADTLVEVTRVKGNHVTVQAATPPDKSFKEDPTNE
jgi:membrane-bound serine protease (ClpP class)